MPEQRTAVPVPVLRGPEGRPLRVAHLTTVDMSLSLLLATELSVDVASGLETFGISAPGPYVEAVEALGVRHVPLPSLSRSWDLRADMRAARELAAALGGLRLDVLHTHNPKTGVLGRVLGRLARVPVVVNTCHGLWTSPDDAAHKRALVLAVEGLAGRWSHFELYQNATDRRSLRHAVPPRRSRLVGNGIDLDRFRPDPELRERVRGELGVRRNEVLVGGVGRLVAEKGIREYAEAARVLGHRARFVWAGPVDEAKADAVRGELSGVRFLGPRQDMSAFYSALDVFVLPSHREGFSRSAMEAAACGLPMVLSDIRGCREVGTHGEHVLLVPARDAAALTAAVGQLLGDPGRRAALGGAARARALACFDQVRVAAASLQAYAEVSTRRRLGWQVAGEEA